MGRQAKGVRLIKLEKDQRLAGVVAFDISEDDQDESSDDDSGQGGTSGQETKKVAVKADAPETSKEVLKADGASAAKTQAGAQAAESDELEELEVMPSKVTPEAHGIDITVDKSVKITDNKTGISVEAKEHDEVHLDLDDGVQQGLFGGSQE